MINDDVLNMVASRPLPGLVSASSISFSPDSKYLTFLYSNSALEDSIKVKINDSNDNDNNNSNSNDISNDKDLKKIDSETQKNSLVQQLFGLKLGSEKDNNNISEKPFVVVGTSKGNDNSLSKDEDDMTLEEKLRRERQRNLNLGITSYTWGTDVDEGYNILLVPLGGNVYIKRMNSDNEGELILAYDHNWTEFVNVHQQQSNHSPGSCMDGKYLIFLYYFI